MVTTARPLPAVLGELIGRDAELQRLAHLVADRRLVTLTGAPGVGKTRLAIEVARRAAKGFRNGTIFVALAAVPDESFVVAAVASGLGLQSEPGNQLTDVIASHIANRRMLVLLDNCEHVIAAVARFADDIVSCCPGLTILATSREPLGVAGEAAWRVNPLDTAARDSAAVRLFVDRARAVDPAFDPTSDEVASIQEICRRLDGLPLAIELAAARVDLFTPDQIVERLNDVFALLSVGRRTAMPRHQTLRAALDWSYELLSEVEQALLRRTSIFVGGWTVESATEVCNGPELPADEIADVLGRLVAKSVVVREKTGAVARYRTLDTVRRYGLSKLEETTEAADYARRHVRWCRALAERGEQELNGPEQVVWAGRLTVEHENVRAALRWALTVGDNEEALRIAAAMAMFWGTRGYVSEGHQWLEDVLHRCGSERPPSYGRAVWSLSFLLSLSSNFGRACGVAETARQLAGLSGDRRTEARSLMVLAICALFIGDRGAAEAMAQFLESSRLAQECGDSWCLLCALSGIAWVRNLHGDPSAARSLLQECLRVAREAKDRMGLVTAINLLGSIALRQGDLVAAEAVVSEAASVAATLGDPRLHAESLNILGEVAARQGDLVVARRLVNESLALSTTSGSRGGMIDSFALLGDITRRSGDLVGARSHFTESLSLAWQVGGTCPAALVGLGKVTLALGDLWAAEALLNRAVSAAEGSTKDRADLADAFLQLGKLDRRRGELDRATSFGRQALAVSNDLRDPVGSAGALELLAGLAALNGRPEHAARLFGAATGLLESTDVSAESAEHARSYDGDLAQLREALTPDAFDAAFAYGRSLSVEDVTQMASEQRRNARRPVSGWASLTKAEREVSQLVAESLTNREIGDRLFISPRTVQTHLAHVFAKLGIASRRDLARAVMKRHDTRPPALDPAEANGSTP